MTNLPQNANGQATMTNSQPVVLASDQSAIPITDNSGSITVDGTVAATQSGTWNVGTVTTVTNVVHVDDNASTLSVDDGGGSITVDGTVAVSGTVTVGSHAVTNAGTFVVQENGAALTSLQLIDDTVYTDGTGTVTKGVAILGQDGTNPQAIKTDASGELQVDVLTMPTVAVTQSGTWDEVGINDSGNSITVDDGGTTISIDDGAGSITVDGTVAVSGTVAVTDNSGSLTVDNGGTFVVQENGAALTALQVIDNPVVVDDAAFTPATTSVMMAGFEFDDTTPDSVNEGDAGAARMSANRNIYVQIRDNAGNERGLNIDSSGNATVNVTGTVTVGSHAVTNAGTFVVQENGAALTSLQLIDDTIATTASAITSKGVAISGTDGTNARVIKTDTSGELQVDVLTMPTTAVSQSGTWTVQPGNTANTTAWKVDASSVAVPVTDNSGSLTVDNNGTFAVQATISAGATSIAKAEDVASADADVGVPAMAVRKATPANTSGLDGDYEMLQMSAGRLWTSSTIDTALPAGTNAIGKLAANSGVDIGDVDVTTVGTITPGTAATSLGKAEDAAHSSGDTGVYILGTRQDTPAATAGTSGDYQSPAFSDAGAEWVTPIANAKAIGSSVSKTDALSTTATAVKASAGNLYGYHIYNSNAVDAFVHFYNIAQGSVTVGTSSRTITLCVPAGGVLDCLFEIPISFSTAITVAATTTITGSSALTTGLLTNIYYL